MGWASRRAAVGDGVNEKQVAATLRQTVEVAPLPARFPQCKRRPRHKDKGVRLRRPNKDQCTTDSNQALTGSKQDRTDSSKANRAAQNGGRRSFAIAIGIVRGMRTVDPRPAAMASRRLQLDRAIRIRTSSATGLIRSSARAEAAEAVAVAGSRDGIAGHAALSDRWITAIAR